MNCYICDQKNWHRLPEINPQRCLMVCKECGNIAFEVDPSKEKDIREYYRKEYRGQITEGNLLTTTRKLNYIERFISDWLRSRELKDDSGKLKKPLVCGDIGAATGYICNFLTQRGHKATGSEWTVTMRRFAEHYYGILTTEDLETKHKYDFIVMYHVLEHVMEPDKKLKRYVDLMADDARILISTPEWMNYLQEAAGSPVGSITNYFHKDHINVFTDISLKNLFNKIGLDIEKEDHICYGQTYFLKKGSIKPIKKENWKNQVDKIFKIKIALEALNDKKYEKALEIWPKFPEAYYGMIFNTHIRKDVGRTRDIFKKALREMPENTMIRNMHAMWLYQNEKYDDALKEYEWLLANRPNEEVFMQRARTLNFLGKKKEAITNFNIAASLNPQLWSEANRWICKICTEIPAWDERLQTEAFEKFKSSNNIKPTLGSDLRSPSLINNGDINNGKEESKQIKKEEKIDVSKKLEVK